MHPRRHPFQHAGRDSIHASARTRSSASVPGAPKKRVFGSLGAFVPRGQIHPGRTSRYDVRNLDENQARRLADFDEHVSMAEELLYPGVLLAHRDLGGTRAIDFEVSRFPGCERSCMRMTVSSGRWAVNMRKIPVASALMHSLPTMSGTSLEYSSVCIRSVNSSWINRRVGLESRQPRWQGVEMESRPTLVEKLPFLQTLGSKVSGPCPWG